MCVCVCVCCEMIERKKEREDLTDRENNLECLSLRISNLI